VISNSGAIISSLLLESSNNSLYFKTVLVNNLKDTMGTTCVAKRLGRITTKASCCSQKVLMNPTPHHHILTYQLIRMNYTTKSLTSRRPQSLINPTLPI